MDIDTKLRYGMLALGVGGFALGALGMHIGPLTVNSGYGGQ